MREHNGRLLLDEYIETALNKSKLVFVDGKFSDGLSSIDSRTSTMSTILNFTATESSVEEIFELNDRIGSDVLLSMQEVVLHIIAIIAFIAIQFMKIYVLSYRNIIKNSMN